MGPSPHKTDGATALAADAEHINLTSACYDNENDAELVVPKSLGKAFGAVVVCGMLNNVGYCIVNGATQDLARDFGLPNQVTVISTAMNFACLAATFISTRFLLQYQFLSRVRLAIFMTASAYAGVGLSTLLPGAAGFTVCALSSCIAGLAQVFGETTNLAFLKSFPPELIGGWGAGTGIAGIGGSLIYILLSGPLGLSNLVIFLLMVPTGLAYYASFLFLHREATQGRDGFRLARVLGGASPSARGGVESSTGLESQETLHPSTSTAPATWANVTAAIRASGGIMFNLVAVYMLEYFINSGLADRETLCANKEWYTALWMSYNVGVTFSRLSVAKFRIKNVWVITVVQLVNAIGWTIEVFTGTVRSMFPHEGGLFIMAVWMAFVGLCGGATYGNCMYMFNHQVGIPEPLRELGINIGFVMSNIGITSATFSFSLLDETIMSEKKLYPPNGCPK